MFKYFIQLLLGLRISPVPTRQRQSEMCLVNIFFFRWERLCKLTITLAPRFNIFWDVFLSAMYISGFLNKRSERLRFRTAFGGDCHLPAQNSSRRQVTSVLQGTKTGGRFNGTISGELLNYMV